MVRHLGLAWLVASLGICILPAGSRAQDEEGPAEQMREITGAEDAEEGDAIKEAGTTAAATEAEPSGESDAASEDSDAEITDGDLDARLVALDGYLGDMQKPSRSYFYGWLAGNAALMGGQIAIAYSFEEGSADRGQYFVGAGCAAAAIGVLLLGPYPAINGAKKFRSMPQGTRDEREAKALAGEKWLMGQAKADTLATSAIPHILGGMLAVGAGLGIGIAYDHAVKQAVTGTLAVLLVSELQIATRPVRSIKYAKQYGSDPSAAPQLAIAPMVDRYAQGVSLVGQF